MKQGWPSQPIRRTPPKCGACETFPSDEEWAALPLLKMLSANDLLPYVTRWNGRSIEVRQCLHCGRGVARAVVPREPVA
jgi:hypothetical protein